MDLLSEQSKLSKREWGSSRMVLWILNCHVSCSNMWTVCFRVFPASVFSQNILFPRSSLIMNGPVQRISSLPPHSMLILWILFQDFVSNLESGVCIVLPVILLLLSFLGTGNAVCCSGTVFILKRALVLSSILLSVGSSETPSPVALHVLRHLRDTLLESFVVRTWTTPSLFLHHSLSQNPIAHSFLWVTMLIFLYLLSYASDVEVRKRFNHCHFLRSHAYARGCQISGGKSKVESPNPRKIGMGVPQILGLLEWGCQLSWCMASVYSHIWIPCILISAGRHGRHKSDRYGDMVFMQSLDISK